MDKPHARKIIDLRHSGKWLEFWFDDGGHNPQKWDECCKSYMLESVIDAAGLGNHVFKHGRVGLWVVWKDDSPVSIARSISEIELEPIESQ